MQVTLDWLIVVLCMVYVTEMHGGELQMPHDIEFKSLPLDFGAAYADLIKLSVEQQKNEEKFRQEFEHLHESKRKAALKYIAELAVTGFGRKFDKDQEEDPWPAAMVVLSTPRDIVVEAIAPELGLDGRMRLILMQGDQDLRHYLEQKIATSPPSIDEYIAYLSRHNFDHSTGLIEFLLSTHPERGFGDLVLIRGKGLRDRNILLTSHYKIWAFLAVLNSDDPNVDTLELQAKNAVEYLSKHAEWWVRLYSAEIVQQFPKLRTDEVTKRLSEDPCELIRKIMVMTNTPKQ